MDSCVIYASKGSAPAKLLGRDATSPLLPSPHSFARLFSPLSRSTPVQEHE